MGSVFASTRSVQIATKCQRSPSVEVFALPPHAPCRLQRSRSPRTQRTRHFASTRSVQIATQALADLPVTIELCLHTLRADCNGNGEGNTLNARELCLHTLRADCNFTTAELIDEVLLCLHTLRADCNSITTAGRATPVIFASTRSVQIATVYDTIYSTDFCFASTRSVQIATAAI